MPAGPEATLGFRHIYDDVTATFIKYIASARLAGIATLDEEAWFTQLIVSFEEAFQQWPVTGNADIQQYLALFEAPHVPRQLRLAGHVFLHVAYDLPRKIAQSFALYPLLNRESQRLIFLRPAPLLRDVFLRQAREGTLGFLARPLGYFKPLTILGYWVFALRCVAWMHAENLQLNPALENDLASALLRSAQEALTEPWLFGVPTLDNNDLLTASPMLTRPAYWIAFVGLLATAGFVVGRMINVEIFNRLQVFGQRVYTNTTAVFEKHVERQSTSSIKREELLALRSLPQRLAIALWRVLTRRRVQEKRVSSA